MISLTGTVMYKALTQRTVMAMAIFGAIYLCENPHGIAAGLGTCPVKEKNVQGVCDGSKGWNTTCNGYKAGCTNTSGNCKDGGAAYASFSADFFLNWSTQGCEPASSQPDAKCYTCDPADNGGLGWVCVVGKEYQLVNCPVAGVVVCTWWDYLAVNACKQ